MEQAQWLDWLLLSALVLGLYAAYLAWLGRQRPTRDVGAWALGLSLAMLAYVNALFHFTNSAGLAGETWRSGPAVLLMVAEVLYAARFLGPRHTLVICGAAFVFGYLRAYTVVRDAFVTPNEQFGRIVQTPEVWAVVFETWTMVPLFLFVLRDYFVTKSLAQTDGLTGLLNHRAFYETLGQLLGEAQRSGQPLSLLLVDVDHFKAFNDRFGHRQGDQVLQTVAALLMTQIRWTDGLFRYGGEEFAVLLPDTGHAAALAVAERLRESVARRPLPGEDGGPPRRLTVSVGVATYPLHGSGPEALVEAADRALYAAKRASRNTVRGASDVPLSEEECR
ncbi:MAG: GGDEF domain-containing protein [Clostridia bacterium]|nr:GGDEF domain-containing protein [Clostridia bacterium]